MMKKLVCMLMALCMLLSAVNVLAVTAIDPHTTSAPTWSNGTHGVAATNANYAFSVTTGGSLYHYQILDEKDADGKKQYYIFANDLYGTLSSVKPVNAAFDPDVETNIAYWLNNDFYNGTATGKGSNIRLDTAIKPYIQKSSYMVEGHTSFGETSQYYYDYTVDANISLLSLSEYNQYKEKIGYQAYWNGSTGLTGASYCAYLRTPYISSTAYALKYMNPANGNVSFANMSENGYSYYIRPSFWVSEDYFKNVKLDLSAAGSEVKKIISKLNPSIYSSEELLSLKGIYTLTEDGSNAISSSDWTYSANVAIDENGYINLTKSKWAARNLPTNVKGGTITIEAEVKEAVGNGLHIGLMYDGDTSPSFKYPFYMMGGDSVGRAGYYSEAASGKGTGFKRLENTSNDLWYNHFNQPFNVKVTVNLDTGNCYVSISGKAASDGSDLVRYSDGTTVLPYISGEKTFSKVAFYNSSASDSKIDNIKITYDPNGNAIKSVEKTGDKEIEITVEDYVDLQSVTKDSICLTANTATAISVNGNKITATLANKLTNGDKCVIVNDMKRNDVGDANYTIIGNSALFTVTAPTETVIGTPVISGDLTSGTKVSATSAVTKGTSTAVKPVQFVIAAYNGDRLIGAKIESIENVNNVNELKAEFTLSENATEIRAFIWDENNYPIRSAVSKDQ